MPYLDRVQGLSATKDDAPRDLIDRAARLPYLEWIDCSGHVPYPCPYPADAPLKAPDRPPEFEIDADAPLPKGTLLEGGEAKEVVQAWKAAWSSPADVPYGTLRVRESMQPNEISYDLVCAYGPNGSVICGSGLLQLTTPRSMSSLQVLDPFSPSSSRLVEGTFVEQSRYSGAFADGYFNDRAAVFHGYATSRAYLERAFHALRARDRWDDVVGRATEGDVADVFRIDERRCRIDFSPIRVLREDGTTEDELRLSAAYVQDEDYPLEGFDLAVLRTDTTGASAPSETHFAWRSKLSLHAGRLLVDAVSGKTPVAHLWSLSAPPSSYEYSHSIAYDFAPLPDGVFQRSSWNAVVFPDPRPLPVWRWYRVTFVLSLALLAFIAAKKVAARFRKDASPLPSSESAEDESMPADAEAVASR